jgi:hypothetical protein
VTSYTLFSQGSVSATFTPSSDPSPYTIGVQFSVSTACILNGIWFYSGTGAVILPQVIALYAVTGTSLIHQETATWSGAAASGWVFAAFSSPPALASGIAYEGCALQDTSAAWYTTTTNYFTSSGVTNGPLSAPSAGSATGAQGAFHAGASLAYPATGFESSNFWADVQVTPGVSPAGPAAVPLHGPVRARYLPGM